MNKNKKKLDSFVKYCEKRPELRFWQALVNWAGFNVSKETIENKEITYKDLFYEE